MMQAKKSETVHRIQVEFTEEEFRILVIRVGDPEPGAEARYIHKIVMRSLSRKPKKAKTGDGQ
jgi:hypothetical protein